jgi:hypothetical protein
MQNLTSRNAHIMTAAGLLLAVTLAVHAVPMPAMAQHVCEPDARRLCSQFIPDESTVGSCLRRNMRNLTADCRAAMGAGKAAKRAARQKAKKARSQ